MRCPLILADGAACPIHTTAQTPLKSICKCFCGLHVDIHFITQNFTCFFRKHIGVFSTAECDKFVRHLDKTYSPTLFLVLTRQLLSSVACVLLRTIKTKRIHFEWNAFSVIILKPFKVTCSINYVHHIGSRGEQSLYPVATFTVCPLSCIIHLQLDPAIRLRKRCAKR